MTYQPKSAGKMADFEQLTLCISVNSSQICIYFCKDLVKGCCHDLVKKFNFQPLSVFKLILLPTRCRYGLHVI